MLKDQNEKIEEDKVEISLFTYILIFIKLKFI